MTFTIRHIARRNKNGQRAFIVYGNYPDSMPETMIFHADSSNRVSLHYESGRIIRLKECKNLTPQFIARYLKGA